MSLIHYQFPPDFVFGVATAAAQIEGATRADGRQDSIWEAFCRQPGAIADGSNTADACRHYQRWQEDLDLLKDLGVGSYRFSVAWPRVIPGGRGAVNAAGLDFYERLVDGMLARGIKPNATLYHWDLPQSLQDKGGWLNRDTAYAYRDYAEAVLKRLGDRVDFWATFNEPQVFIHLGYEHGHHAPGLKLGRRDVLQAIHHVLLAHGMGMQVIRAHKKPGAQAGIVFAPAPIWPGSESPADVAAAERHWHRTNDWWTLPLIRGGYPADVVALLGDDAPRLQPGDEAQMKQGLDFLGINYYSPERIIHDPAKGPLDAAHGPRPDGAPMADFPGWEIFAPGLQNMVTQFWRRYGVPLYVTENGTSSVSDAPSADGAVHDPKRLAFIRDHLIHCLRAIQGGADLRGYYVWSLMDNFEWGFGYSQRFGLVHVDYATFERTPKDSYRWYQGVCREHGFQGPALPEIRSGFETQSTALRNG
jgi:beta-glucosidase